jgi:hypothetical protein
MRHLRYLPLYALALPLLFGLAAALATALASGFPVRP